MSISVPGTSVPARNAYIDTLRGVAIFGVVCIHFAGSFITVDHAWSPSFYVGLIFGQIFNFAVPLFIFLSGFLAGKSRKTPDSLGDYYRQRFVRIGLPYLAVSVISFFALNHYVKWLELPTGEVKFTWLLQKLFFYGVEPTLYFIPLILQLYLLQPALKALPRWIQHAASRLFRLNLRPESVVLGLALLLLVIHVILGQLCYRGTLSYYTWCRPNGIFWLVYFFCGLHFNSLLSFMNRRRWALWGGLCLLVAVGAMAANFQVLTDRSVVGARFELNNMDVAYCRPQLLIFDLAAVGALAVGLGLGWTWRPSILSFLGAYTLEIYLWHILLLYEGAWRHAPVLAACREMPEVIILIAGTACLLIAGSKHLYTTTSAIVRQYRLVLIKDPW